MAAAGFTMPRFLKSVALVLAALAAVLAFGVARAGATAPCWELLLNDEYDGHIDHTYPLHCYTEALAHLHPDIQIYGSYYDDIHRAMEAAILAYHNQNGPGDPPPDTPVPAQRSLQTHSDKGFIQSVASDLGPGNATSIPLPLLILAGLGLLLIAAAGASYGARRLQARRAGGNPRPAHSPATPPDAPK
ncbi:MAG TPA: hypothetical protein VEH52_12270 [Gaiellaceae bacterium]|nr:hypothetical protein [Gaiellaceae bacterium]